MSSWLLQEINFNFKSKILRVQSKEKKKKKKNRQTLHACRKVFEFLSYFFFFLFIIELEKYKKHKKDNEILSKFLGEYQKACKELWIEKNKKKNKKNS